MSVHADRPFFSGRRTPRRAWGCTSTPENIEIRTTEGQIVCPESREPRTFARRPSSIGSNQLSKSRPSASSARAGVAWLPWRGLQPGAPTSGIRVANPGDYATLNPTTFARGDAARHSAMSRRSSGKLGTTRDKLIVGACPSELGGHIVARLSTDAVACMQWRDVRLVSDTVEAGAHPTTENVETSCGCKGLHQPGPIRALRSNCIRDALLSEAALGRACKFLVLR